MRRRRERAARLIMAAAFAVGLGPLWWWAIIGLRVEIAVASAVTCAAFVLVACTIAGLPGTRKAVDA